MDHHVPRAITNGLRLRGVDVLTAHEDGASALRDPVMLDRTSELGRVLFTQDDDLLTEATHRQYRGQPFAGVIYAHQLRISIGDCVRDLPARTEDEPRFLVVGVISGKHWSAVITYRGNNVRIISVRRARMEEVEIYEG